MVWVALFSHIVLVFILSFYLIANLQIYSYKFNRVIFHHPKPSWHLIYFLLPLFAYYLLDIYFWIFFYFAYLPAFLLWYKKLDKKLVFTDRIKRFFSIVAVLVLFQDFLCLASQNCQIYGLIMLITFATIGSFAIEKLLFETYKRRAKKKLQKFENLIVIGITASYGKTSIKNFLHHLLKDEYKTYKTPRSVNTISGIVKDINEDLPLDTRVYIVEMGARVRGDIKEIVDLIQPHYSIVGQIGTAHLEYFKTLENIRDTKLEAVYSKRLKKAFVHNSAKIKPYEKVIEFNSNLQTKATLDGVDFVFENEAYHANLLGAFNAQNIALALSVAQELGINNAKEKVATIEPVQHRLQKIAANGKIIIDDSYNGNYDGMVESFELIKQYKGRKVLITAGLIEANEVLNQQIAQKANEIFDFIVVTSQTNYKVFHDAIDNEKFKRLQDKSKMQEFLAQNTMPNDLILFANDAPNFI